MNIFDHYHQRCEAAKGEEFTLQEFLTTCRRNRSAYAGAIERLLMAVGKPVMVDTAQELRLSRLFSDQIIARYPTFEEFYGVGDAIEQIVSCLKRAARGLEEKKQILYLLEPVGGSKSSFAKRLKSLMQFAPIYILSANDERGPVNDHPFRLFSLQEDVRVLEEECGVPRRYLGTIISPWAVERLYEFGDDIIRFRIVEVWPSIPQQVAITKTEPGDENNQGISALVGRIDTRRLEHYTQNDLDTYDYSDTLYRVNQGIMEFIEMFKAPTKALHPLLTVTQEGDYNGTEGISAPPLSGIVLTYSNESERVTSRNNKGNEAFLDRIYIIKVPYHLRISEETKIYEKLLNHSKLAHAPCAPGMPEALSCFSILSRLREPKDSSVYSKIRVCDGESLKDADPKIRSYQGYRDYVSVDEGMNDLLTRPASRVLSRVFNFDHVGVAANLVHLFYVLEQQIEHEQFPQGQTEHYLEPLKGCLIPKYVEFTGKEIRTIYPESYSEHGQDAFSRYVIYTGSWVQDQEYRDPDAGQLFNHRSLNAELEKIEKPTGINNPGDFRSGIVNSVLYARASDSGRNPSWTDYEELCTVIEKKMFFNTEELLPVISFSTKMSADEQKEHDDFIDRMMGKDYTRKQVRSLCR